MLHSHPWFKRLHPDEDYLDLELLQMCLVIAYFQYHLQFRQTHLITGFGPILFSHTGAFFFFRSSAHIEFDYWIWLQVVIYYCVRNVDNVDNLIHCMWKFNIVVKGDIISKEYWIQPGIYFIKLSGAPLQILERPLRSGFSSGKQMEKASFMWNATHAVGSSCVFIPRP